MFPTILVKPKIIDFDSYGNGLLGLAIIGAMMQGKSVDYAVGSTYISQADMNAVLADLDTNRPKVIKMSANTGSINYELLFENVVCGYANGVIVGVSFSGTLAVNNAVASVNVAISRTMGVSVTTTVKAFSPSP